MVITSALHAVGRRFEPGIQYDSLFFCFENVESPQASHTNFYARESRGRREACKTVPFVNSRYIQTPLSY